MFFLLQTKYLSYKKSLALKIPFVKPFINITKNNFIISFTKKNDCCNKKQQNFINKRVVPNKKEVLLRQFYKKDKI